MQSLNKMKVMLIGTPLTGKLEAGITNTKVPLGLAYIAAVLEESGASLKILDCLADYDVITDIGNGNFRVGTTEEEVKKQIKEFKPDVVGINCSYSAYEKDSFDIVKIVKDIFPESLIVFGGHHASAAPKNILKNKDVDIIVVGEAEYTFREIIEKFSKSKRKSNLKNIKGTIVLDKNGKIKINPERDLIRNLDELPVPARHLLRMNKYLEHPLVDIGVIRGPVTDMITSRGCPQNCPFCSVFTVWRRVWRARSAKKVVDEIEDLVNKYGIKHIRIQDDNFAVDRKRVIQICEGIINRGLKFKWDTPNGVGIWTLDEEVLNKMVKSGYQRATFGIETGSSRILKKYTGKPINYDHARKIIKICNKLGIWTVSTFIIGFPDETLEEMEMTYNFAKTAGLDFAFFYVAQPYAGTPLYEQFKREHLIKDFKESSSVHFTIYNSHNFTGEELQRLQKGFQRRFVRHKITTMLNPFNFVKWMTEKIRSYDDFIFAIKMIKSIVPFQSLSFFRKSLKNIKH